MYQNKLANKGYRGLVGEMAGGNPRDFLLSFKELYFINWPVLPILYASLIISSSSLLIFLPNILLN